MTKDEDIEKVEKKLKKLQDKLAKIEEENDEEDEDEYEPRKSGGGAGAVLIIILLILLGIGAYIIIQSGAVEKAVDPCERSFSDCNHGCGSGILSSVCKEKCSYDYRSCKSG